MTHLVDFDDLAHALIRIDAAAEAAESHGILCGLFCSDGRADRSEWIRQVLGEEQDPANGLVREAIAMLEKLYQSTLEEMFDELGQIELLIPGDDVSITERMESISEWCQGFLLGFSHNYQRNKGDLPEEIEELLADFVEITKVDLESTGDEEEDENALMEIEEYIRVGVVFIMESLHPRVSSPGLQ
jgi:yecA family protein